MAENKEMKRQTKIIIYVISIIVIIILAYWIYKKWLSAKPESGLLCNGQIEPFQSPPATTSMRKWYSSITLNGSANFISYGLNFSDMPNVDFVAITIPNSTTTIATTFGGIKNAQLNNMTTISALEYIFSHPNMKYIFTTGIALNKPDPEYIPITYENGTRSLTMFNSNIPGSTRYISIKPAPATDSSGNRFNYMGYIVYYVDNTNLTTTFTDQMASLNTTLAQSTVPAIMPVPAKLIASSSLPLSGKPTTTSTTANTILPLYFRQSFLERDINSANYKKLIDDDGTASMDHSIYYSNISLNIHPTVTFNSKYAYMYSTEEYAIWDFNSEFGNFLSLTFRNEVATISYTNVLTDKCAYLYFTINGVKQYLYISNIPYSTTTNTVLTTTIKTQATKFSIFAGASTIKYIAYNSLNGLPNSYILGVDCVNISTTQNVPVPALKYYVCDTAKLEPAFNVTNFPYGILKQRGQIHNDRMPWFLFNYTLGNVSVRFIYGSGNYNTYLTYNSLTKAIQIKNGTTRNTPAADSLALTYEDASIQGITYETPALIRNLYKMPADNFYIFTCPATSAGHNYSKLHLYPQNTQLAHYIDSNNQVKFNSYPANTLQSATTFYHYNMTTQASTITLTNFTTNVLTCPQTSNINIQLAKFVPATETFPADYTKKAKTWLIKSATQPAVNNKQVYIYEHNTNPIIQLLVSPDNQFVIFNQSTNTLGFVNVAGININDQNTIYYTNKFIYYRHLIRFTYTSSTNKYSINEIPLADRVLYPLDIVLEEYIAPTTTTLYVPPPVEIKQPAAVAEPVKPADTTTTTTTEYVPTTTTTTTEYIPTTTTTTTTEYIPTTTTTTSYTPSEEEPPLNTKFYEPGSAGVPKV